MNTPVRNPSRRARQRFEWDRDAVALKNAPSAQEYRSGWGG
jgi:hypothetical protein